MYPKKVHFPGASLVVGLFALGLAGGALAASYTVRPEIDVEQTLDDNVLSGEDQAGDGGPSNEITSWNTRMAPSVTLDRKSDTSEASLQLGLTRRQTAKLSELNGTDERLGTSVRRTLTPRLSIGARAGYQFYAAYNTIENSPASGNPQVLYAERPDLTWHSLASDLRYVLDDTTELTGELEWNSWEYDQTDRTDLYNNEDRSISLGLTRQLTPTDKAGVTLGLTSTEEESSETGFQPVFSGNVFYTSFETQNRNELGTALAFWQRNWSPRWTTSLQAGIRTLDSESDNVQRFIVTCPAGACLATNFDEASDSGTGFVGGGSLMHNYSDRGQVSLSYSRDTRTGTSSATGSSSIDTDSLVAGLAHRLSARLTLMLRGSFQVYENTSEAEVLLDDDSRATTTIDSGSKTRLRSTELRLDWQVRKNLIAYTSFNYFDLDQDRPRSFSDPNRNYARRILGFGVRYSFDHEL